MKKIIFGLIAAMMFSFAGNAQTDEQRESFADGQMVSLVHGMKGFYEEGMSLDQWIQTTGPTMPTDNDLQLLQKTYTYVSQGVSDCEIIEADNSIIIAVAEAPASGGGEPNARKFCWRCFIAGLIAFWEAYNEAL